ncbi:alpha/beta hydrolase [Lampropedia cohaerens]|uniref:Alpha/beta hydrolase n=1 Tax=Lampropedia cohaerens TaxID=1610491 RepID=A0A0U1PYH8_9BURK|nr:alpha/beta fold hydrolase [Lampropedia cohaerens]KKW67526.1 alpha/beta hydrolase [Lampropedia cohaerens]
MHPIPTVLTLPGWRNSGPQHWQSRWEALYGYQRVQQHDWLHPRSGDWQIQLEEAVLAADPTRPIVLVAHSLGCQLVARWAMYSQNTQRVHAAMLVAPPDTESPYCREVLPTWQPIAARQLPFASLVVASTDDAFCTLQRAQWMATCWGSTFHNLGPAGHINADSGLGDWPEGHQLLLQLLAQC